MLAGRVASHHQDTIRLLDLPNGVRHSPAPECGGKTCHRGGVSEPRAVIDIVRSQDTPCKFHDQIVFLVGALCAGEYTEGVRPVGIFDTQEPLGNSLVGLFPFHLNKSIPILNERPGEAIFVLNLSSSFKTKIASEIVFSSPLLQR